MKKSELATLFHRVNRVVKVATSSAASISITVQCATIPQSESQSLPYEARKQAAAPSLSCQSRHLHTIIIIAGVYMIHAIVCLNWANYINRAVVSFLLL